MGKVTRSQVKDNLDRDNILVLNVHNGADWVLATRYEDDNISINDPNYSPPFYTLDQIVENQLGIYRVGNGLLSMMINELETALKIEKKVKRPKIM